MNADGSNLRSVPGSIAGREPAWSPDGRRFAFLSYRDRHGKVCDRERCYPNAEVYVVRTDGTGLRRLTRTRADEAAPALSPDGRWVAFARGPRILRVRATGGREQLIVRMPDGVDDPAWRR
jgi:Tol biopolymer transport system component